MLRQASQAGGKDQRRVLRGNALDNTIDKMFKTLTIWYLQTNN